MVLGLLLVLLGAYFLVRQAMPEVDLGRVWPLVVMGLGVVLIFAAFRPGRART